MSKLVKRIRAASAPVRKAVVAVAGAVAQALALGLVPAPYDKYLSITLAVLTAAGVYGAKNIPTASVDKKAGANASTEFS